MTTATDVASYINSRPNLLMDNRKLQKLVYFSHAWALGWTGRPLVASTFEAWPDGPVNRALWVCQRHTFVPAYEGQLSDEQVEIVDAVLAYYITMSSAELVEISHEGVWGAARGDLPTKSPSQNELDNEMLRDHYVRLAVAGKGPRWVPAVKQANATGVVDTARVISARWKDGLDLLATK